MRWVKRIVGWLMVAALAFFTPVAIRELPSLGEGVVFGGQSSYAGVLRVWVLSGWESGNGSFTAWLSECAAKFEKQNRGVYVQFTPVDEQTMRNFAATSPYPPDLILFGTNVLESADGLEPIGESYAVREAFADCGLVGGVRYAQPIAAGGYAIARNTALAPAPGADWSGLRLGVPEDNAHHRYSAALEAILAAGVNVEIEKKKVGEGIDLGLSDPSATDAPEVQLTAIVPPGEVITADYQTFVNGEVDALVVTQREIRRLAQRAESCKGPEYSIEFAAGYTDQVLLAGIPVSDRSGQERRLEAIHRFIRLLASDDMQAKLTKSRAFPVASIAPIYDVRGDFTAIEEALASPALWVEFGF